MSKLVLLGLASIASLVVASAVSPSTAEEQPIYSFEVEESRMILLEPQPEELAVIEKTYKKNEQMSPEDLRDLLHSVGFRGQALKEAWGTAMKESTGRPRAHNDNPATGDNSYGLFQINMIGSLGPARLKQFDLEKNSDLFDPVRNAEIAYFMSNGGKNWSAWHGITEKTKEWMKEFPN